jgi:hypothetical protein
LDGTPAAITVLPEIAQALQGDVPIIMDSGIRRGIDIVKAREQQRCKKGSRRLPQETYLDNPP